MVHIIVTISNITAEGRPDMTNVSVGSKIESGKRYNLWHNLKIGRLIIHYGPYECIFFNISL
jgi:hypothetical protein